MSADYRIGTKCLQENLLSMTDSSGQVAPDDLVLWNVSNALLVVLSGLEEIDLRLQKLERQQLG